MALINVDPDDLGAHYQDMKLALDTEVTDLQVAQEIYSFRGRCTSGSPDSQTQSITMGAWNSNADYFVRIYTDTAENYRHPGHPNTGSETHYRIVSSRGWGDALVVGNGAAFTRLEGIHIHRTGSGTGTYNALEPAGNCTIDACILQDDNGCGSYTYSNSVGGTVYSNCLLMGGTSAMCTGFGSGVTWVNCVFADSPIGIDSNSASYTNDWINCLVTGCPTSVDTSALATGCSFTNAAFEDDPLNGWGGTVTDCRSNQTFTFEDAANEDFHLSSSDTGAIGYGIGPGSNSYVTPNDMDGDAREETCNIGFDEHAGGGTTLQGVCSDGVAFSDSAVRSAIIQATCDDGLALGDATGKTATFPVTLADGILFSDTSLINAILQAAADDGVVFSDSTIASVISSILAECADGIAFSDSATTRADLQAAADDGILLGDVIGTVLTAYATAGDGVTFSDSATWQAAIQALAADGIVLSDSAQRSLRILVHAADGILLTDAGEARANFVVECADGVQFADTISEIMRLSASCADGVVFSDSASDDSTLPSGSVTITFSAGGPSIAVTVMRPKIDIS